MRVAGLEIFFRGCAVKRGVRTCVIEVRLRESLRIRNVPSRGGGCFLKNLQGGMHGIVKGRDVDAKRVFAFRRWLSLEEL